MDVELGEIEEIVEVESPSKSPIKSPSDSLSGLLSEPLSEPSSSPPRDHMLHLARMIPAQCLDKTEPLYHPSTRSVYEFVCSSVGVYEPCFSAPVTDTPYVIENIKGSCVLSMFPELPHDAPIRPAAQYAVVCYPY